MTRNELRSLVYEAAGSEEAMDAVLELLAPVCVVCLHDIREAPICRTCVEASVDRHAAEYPSTDSCPRLAARA